MKKYYLLLLGLIFSMTLTAQISDVYYGRIYVADEDISLSITASRMPNKDHNEGILAVSVDAYKGKDIQGSKLMATNYTLLLDEIVNSKKYKGYSTFKYDFGGDSETEIKPEPGSYLAFLNLYFTTDAEKVYFDEEEMFMVIDENVFELFATDIELEVKEEERDDLSDAEKFIVEEESLYYEYALDNEDENGKAYIITARVKEFDKGVIEVFGWYFVAKMKNGEVKKAIGKYYYDYKVNEVRFAQSDEESVLIDVNIKNYDNEKTYKSKGVDKTFEVIADALKNNTILKLSKSHMEFTDSHGNKYIFERLEE